MTRLELVALLANIFLITAGAFNLWIWAAYGYWWNLAVGIFAVASAGWNFARFWRNR